MALDPAAWVEAYWEAEVVGLGLHSCREAALVQDEGPGPDRDQDQDLAHLASAVEEFRLPSVQVVQEVLAAYTEASCWTLWRHDRAEPVAAVRLSLYGFCPAPAALRQRCWRRRRRAGRKRPGQTGARLGRSCDLPGPGIAPCCVSSAVGLVCCSGAESARHPALPTAHRPLCSLGFDSGPYPCQYRGVQEGRASLRWSRPAQLHSGMIEGDVLQVGKEEGVSERA